MQFQIKQLNTDNYTNKEEVAQVLKGAWLNFINDDSEIDTILKKEVLNYENSQNPLHYFYLLDPQTGDIAASMGTVIRNSTIPSKKDIVLTVVNTNKEYRKKGLMEKLISFVLALYEDKDFDSVKDYFSYDDQFINDSKAFIGKYAFEGSFWTLYSAVGDYYARFGFASVKTMNYYTIPCTEFYNSKYETKFDINDNETFLTIENSNKYLFEDAYIPGVTSLSEEPTRSCSFKNGSIMRFIHGNRIYFDSKGINIPHYGLIIESNKGTTVFCITHFFDPAIFATRRFFTNVSDDDALNTHLDRIYEYITWYVNNFSLDKENSNIIFSEGDIVSSKQAKAKVLDYFKNKKWAWNDSNIRWNPMLREWKAKTPVGEWKYNGFWCFS